MRGAPQDVRDAMARTIEAAKLNVDGPWQGGNTERLNDAVAEADRGVLSALDRWRA